eukprot:scaffold142889_cov15-Tisochrysis_lutea.AAC.1
MLCHGNILEPKGPNESKNEPKCGDLADQIWASGHQKAGFILLIRHIARGLGQRLPKELNPRLEVAGTLRAGNKPVLGASCTSGISSSFSMAMLH